MPQQHSRLGLIARILGKREVGSGRASDAAPIGPIAPQRGSARSRWSADSWLLLRDDSGGALANGTMPASYGASQAGGVLRYGFAPDSDHRPAAYVRVSSALASSSSDSEVAAGVLARPLARVPVILAAELRATRGTQGARLRPAALAITQLPAFPLPLRTRGEAYLQGGYVGGAYATGFVDGQFRADRLAMQHGRAQLRLGAGLWGGAQKDASRLDLGPGATLGVGLGRSASARIAVDWRLRVAGNAAPGSGPVLTVSAGF